MSHRRLFVLGTSSQVPTRYRNHNGYLLAWDSLGFLFDPGEGTQRQMTHAGLAVSRIHHILITHFHGDHCLGLAGIIQRLSLDRVTRPVHVFYPASGQPYLDRLRKAAIFHDVTNLVLHPIGKPGPIYSAQGLTISCLPLKHGVPCLGYRIEEADDVRMLPEKLKALGIQGAEIGELKRKGRLHKDGRTIDLHAVSEPKKGQALAFVMDTRECQAARDLAQGVDMLVCESTFLQSEAREAREHGHLTAAQAAAVARDAGAGKLVLTHFSQRYASTAPFLEEAAPIHADVVAVQDGDVVPVPRKT